MNLDGYIIDQNSDCYVIAEIGHNHGGDLEKCKRMCLAAQQSGANAVKLQKRDNRALYTKALTATARRNQGINHFIIMASRHTSVSFSVQNYQTVYPPPTNSG